MRKTVNFFLLANVSSKIKTKDPTDRLLCLYLDTVFMGERFSVCVENQFRWSVTLTMVRNIIKIITNKSL